MNIINYPVLPLWTPIPNGLHVGKLIEVQGMVPYGVDVFQINLTNGYDMGSVYADRHLHISLRFDENGRRVVVRNAHFGGWGREERGFDFPFSVANRFVVIILVKQDGFHIAVNGTHRWIFNHRSPYYSANVLNISGTVTIEKVTFSDAVQAIRPAPIVQVPYAFQLTRQQSTSLIIDNPTVPFSYDIPGGLRSGCMFHVRGTPNRSSNRITINLQSHGSSYPPPDIAFHFDIRFQSRTVVRNTRVDNSYGPEELSVPSFVFSCDAVFDMFIDVDQHKYKVTVNGNPFVEYIHRYLPLSKVKVLQISGCLTLKSVRIVAP